ncbi:hypothetical protein HUJ04_008032 [Dendroctonus ponderosae]|nr:hypothetical protein HUJ04_008032 [Dendroctonus ponderosae]
MLREFLFGDLSKKQLFARSSQLRSDQHLSNRVQQQINSRIKKKESSFLLTGFHLLIIEE